MLLWSELCDCIMILMTVEMLSAKIVCYISNGLPSAAYSMVSELLSLIHLVIQSYVGTTDGLEQNCRSPWKYKAYSESNCRSFTIYFLNKEIDKN